MTNPEPEHDASPWSRVHDEVRDTLADLGPLYRSFERTDRNGQTIRLTVHEAPHPDHRPHIDQGRFFYAPSRSHDWFVHTNDEQTISPDALAELAENCENGGGVALLIGHSNAGLYGTSYYIIERGEHKYLSDDPDGPAFALILDAKTLAQSGMTRDQVRAYYEGLARPLMMFYNGESYAALRFEVQNKGTREEAVRLLGSPELDLYDPDLWIAEHTADHLWIETTTQRRPPADPLARPLPIRQEHKA